MKITTREQAIQALDEMVDFVNSCGKFIKKYDFEDIKDTSKEVVLCSIGTTANKSMHIYYGIKTLAKLADKELSYREEDDKHCSRVAFEYKGIEFFELASEDKEDEDD